MENVILVESKLQILHAYKIYKPDVEGGIPQVISALTEGAPSNIESSILVARPQGPAREFLSNYVSVRASATLRTVFSMPISPDYVASFVKQSAKVDIVVHHAPFPLTDIAISMFGLRARLVVHWHAEILNRTLLKALLAPAIRNTLERADRIIVSHPSIVQHSEFLLPYHEKCIAIPYGIDNTFWSTLSFDEAECSQRIKMRTPNLILAIGRLVPYKGFPVLLQAMQGIDANLVIIGEGPLLNDLKLQADALGLSSNVEFVGRLSRDLIKTYLHSARMLVMPSISAAEAFGIVQIEAMASGCPIINTALLTAVPHVARHEKEGLTVAVGNVLELRQAIQRLLNDIDLGMRLGKAGQIRAAKEFDSRQFQQSNLDLYRQLHRPRRP